MQRKGPWTAEGYPGVHLELAVPALDIELLDGAWGVGATGVDRYVYAPHSLNGTQQME